MARLDGKVAVISGAARGQGRAHAVRLAREGATIVAFDLCAPLEHTLTPGATEEELRETQNLVEAEDQRCLTSKTDARDLAGLQALADQVMEEFGRVDILVVNHGLWVVEEDSLEAVSEGSWQESIDVLLTGGWKVAKAFVPKIKQGGKGGSVIFTTSVNSIQPQPSAGAYCAAKAGVAMLVKVLAWELGEFNIRVNAVAPGGIATPMLLEGGTVEKAAEMRPRYITNNRNLLPYEWQPPESVANVVAFLAGEDSAYMTGLNMPVDSGWSTC